MRWIGHVVFALGLLCVAQGSALVWGYQTFDAAPDLPSFSCGYTRLTGIFTAQQATYSAAGSCLQLNAPSPISVVWTAVGAHHEGIGFTEERIFLSGPSPYRGEIYFTMVCAGLRSNFDPWLTKGICSAHKTPVVQGEVATQKDLLDVIYTQVRERGYPLSASFPYDRQPLLAQREADLKAEAAWVAQEQNRQAQILQGAKLPSGPTGPYTALLHPFVLQPTAGQILAPQRPVSIKLAPPKGWTVTGYMVNIQRKEANGTWVNHTSITIGAAQAHSPTGYTGFGGGAPPAFLMLPGRWRLSAQASSPKQSGVSDWVEFAAVESADFTAKKRTSSVFPSAGQSTMQSTLPPTGLPSGVGSPPTVVDSITATDAPIRSNQRQPLVTTGLPSGVGSPPTVLYSIASTGTLGWYRHNGAQTGAGLNAPGAWSGPTEVGSGWQNFKQVIPGGGNILYSIASTGTLRWYRHNGAQTGAGLNAPGAWSGPTEVGSGWQNFKQVFSGSDGILYAIAQDGTLKWYRHTGYSDGSATWEGPKNVGTGWQNFKEVFGMGDGIIYAIAGDGKLKWYKHTGVRDGTMAWEGPKDVGTGWQNFKQVFGAGNGVIYAIAGDGILKWYKHTGYRDGSFNWEGPKDIGTGWQGFSKVVSLLPLTTVLSQR